MGNCKYCGEKAGLLKNEHHECKEKYQAGKEKIIESVQTSIISKSNLEKLETEINEIADNSFIENEEIQSCLIEGWEAAIEQELGKGLITEKHEEKTDEFIEFFEIDMQDLNQNSWMEKAVQSLIIDNLRKGKIVKKAKFTQIPANFFPDGEKAMWIFDDVNYYLGVMHDRISLDGKNYLVKNPPKSMKDYKNYPSSTLKSKESLFMDIGSFMITNKFVYFAGQKNRFKMRFRNIISLNKYDDGIEIQKGNMINSPMFFETNNGWFTYELIKGLRELAFSTGNS